MILFLIFVFNNQIVSIEMIDDRPIKPDKKYLEEYIERISKV